MNRKDYKRMYVWNDARPKIPHKRVVLWSDEISCIAVNGDWEEEFLRDSVVRTRYWQHYEEVPKPKMRPMTRNEVLSFIAYHPHTLVKRLQDVWLLPAFFSFNNQLSDYEWASITEDGFIGEPRKFEVIDE